MSPTTLLGTTMDVWEFDGGRWAVRDAGQSPSERYYSQLAYDSARGASVLFGGSGSGANPGQPTDTWELRTTGWASVMPNHSPPPIQTGAMAFDVARQRTVLFGGGFASTTYSDTWELNGVDWTRRQMSEAPSARYAHAMVYDAANRRLVMFGGSSSQGSTTDTWTMGMDTTRGPAHVFVARCDDRVIPAGAVVKSVTPVFVSGGTSASGNGVLLKVWQSYLPVTLSTSNAAAAAPTELRATLNQPAQLAGLCSEGAMRFSVTTPSGSSFKTVGTDEIVDVYATVSTDYAEVRVRYDLP